MKILRFSSILFLLCSASTVHSAGLPDYYGELVGKLFMQDGGSSCGSMLMSNSLLVRSRNTVEVSFSSLGLCWSSANIESSEENEKLSVMVNCKTYTFSVSSEADNNYAQKIFLAGSAYKWNDYKNEKGFASMGIPVAEMKKMSSYFKKVCAHTSEY